MPPGSFSRRKLGRAADPGACIVLRGKISLRLAPYMVQDTSPHSPPPDPTSSFWEEEGFQELPVLGLRAGLPSQPPLALATGDGNLPPSLFFDLLKLARGSIPDIW